MRKLITIFTVGVIAIAIAVWNSAALAQILKALDPNKPVSVIENGTERSVGVTDASGAFKAALDANKEWVVYKMECSRYAIMQSGSKDDQACRAESKQSQSQDPKGCGKCVPVGYITRGQFRTSQMSSSSGRNPLTSPYVYVPAIGLGAAAIAIGASGGSQPATGATNVTTSATNVTPSAPVAPAPPTSFAGSGPVSYAATGVARGCNLIAPSYTASGTYTVTNSPNVVTLLINDPGGANQTLNGPANFAPAANGLVANVVTFGASAWTSASGRNYETSGSNGTFQSNGSGSFTLVHTYRSGGAAGPPSGCQDTYNVVVAPR